MSNILMMAPTSFANFSVSRGSGYANLLTPDPREVWVDSAVGSAATIDIDFGVATAIDTVFLGCVTQPTVDATWTITGGTAGYTDIVIKASGDLRVPERAGRFTTFSHAFWHGDDVLIRYMRITLLQPAGASPLSIGALMAGLAFEPAFNVEWGSGRGVKDTGVVTRLPSGGLVIVEGARYATYKWVLGNLTDDEMDFLFEMQLDRGETRRMLVVEDAAQTAGLRNRIHYGVLSGMRQADRRGTGQTSWEFLLEEWVTETGAITQMLAAPAMTLTGQPISFGGELLTIGA